MPITSKGWFGEKVSLLALTITLACSCEETTVYIQGPQKTNAPAAFSVKAFIENSGSMNGYTVDGSEFKSDVYSYLTALDSFADTMQLSYINSKKIPLQVSLGDLVGRLSPQAFARGGGNTANSNFKQILSDVITEATDSTVVFLVSDCILDIPRGAAIGYLDITRTDVNNIVSNKLKSMPDLGICIYQMESKFDGTYYYPKGGHQLYKGYRPYYIWMIGSQCNLAFLLRNLPDTKFLHEVKNYCAFAPSVNFPYVLYSAGKEQQNLKLKTNESGRSTFNILADISLCLQGEDYVQNPANYFSMSGNIKVERVASLPLSNNYSHQLTVGVPDMGFSDFLKLRANELPLWITEANGEKDDMIEAGKTFSIKSIIGGVADAYGKYKEAGKLTLTVRNN